jgi:hypothetical protein
MGSWWFADWWAYVELPAGLLAKFPIPWWWQVIESEIAGGEVGGLVAGT